MRARAFRLVWHNWSLVSRLMAGSGAALVVSAAVLAYASLHSEIGAERELLEKRLHDEVAFVAPVVARYAAAGDRAAIERVLRARTRREEVRIMFWTGAHGDRIEVAGPPAHKQAPDWFINWTDLSYFTHSAGVRAGAPSLGRLTVELTPLPAINALWSGLLDKLQIFALGVGVFFAVAIQILSNGLAPLFRLAGAAQRFGQGDHSVRIPVEGAPEMRWGIKAFNSMAASIERLVTSLRESEARKRLLATIVEQSDQAIFTEDLDGVITSWNAGAEELFGYRQEDVIGKDYALLVPSEDKANLRAAERIRSAQKLCCETNMVTRNGTIIDIEISAAPMFDDSGAHSGEITIARDITERKRTQSQLLHAKKAAEAASRAKSDFVANMSHEIRTPMNGILGFTELVLDSELSPEQRDNLNAVKSSAESLLGVINDILDFSKIEAGRLDIESILFSLRDGLAQTMKSLDLRAHQKGLRLEWEVAPEIPDTIVGDPVRLRQVIVNLAGNAIKFTERGKVRLDVAMESSGSGNARLRFTVSDTGIGIPLEKQHLIFEAFSQADTSTTREYGGTGLGLTIAARLVELMGGAISVDSEPGKGSAFTFTVTVGLNREDWRRPRPAAGATAQPFFFPLATPKSRLAILVAEDNPVNQKLAVRLLEKLGHRVLVVDNGEAAMQAIKTQRFDAVLMDLQMPVMGGLAACAEIRAWESTRGAHVPIIAMTAHAMQGDRERCLDGGMDGYVSKPVDIAALVAALEAVAPVTADRVPAGAPVEAEPVTDTAVNVDLLLERLDNDRALARELICVFMAECPKSIAEIEAALRAGSSDGVHRTAHKFKGSAGTLAAQNAAAIALALESAGRSGDLGRAEKLFSQLKDETARLLPQLDEISASFGREANRA